MQYLSDPVAAAVARDGRPPWRTGTTWWRRHSPEMQYLSDPVAAAAVAIDADGVSVPAAAALDPETGVSLRSTKDLLSNCWAGPNSANFIYFFIINVLLGCRA
jgi:hypothetical protein